MPKKITLQDAMDLIAGATDAQTLRAIVSNLRVMDEQVQAISKDPDRKCKQVAQALKKGYKNWTGESL